MDQRLIDIGIRRGRLIERIARQRALLGEQLQPVRGVLDATDRGIARVRTGVDYLRQRPELVVAAIALLIILKPRRVWRWAKRGFVAWRTWRAVRGQLAVFGLRSRG